MAEFHILADFVNYASWPLGREEAALYRLLAQLQLNRPNSGPELYLLLLARDRRVVHSHAA